MPLDYENLLFVAHRRTGLEYSGDQPYEEALRVLIDSCYAEARLSLLGQIAARQNLLELLETRFRLLDFWQRTPEIQEQAVSPQIFITGTPKSGSTFLHRLLGHDLNNRMPHMWEVMFPLPAPMCVAFDSDFRIRETDKRLRLLRWTHPAADDVRNLINILRNAPRPLLMHCQAGADRSGLAAAIWKVVVDNQSKKEADEQLSILYGHLPIGSSSAMDNCFQKWNPDVALN